MKKLLFILLTLGIFSCSQEQGYKINVNLEGSEGTILLEKRESGAYVTKDSAEVSNGSAVLKGTVEIPEMYYISVKGERSKLPILVENSAISVTGKADSISNAKIMGSTAHDDYNGVVSEINRVSEEYMALYEESRKLASEGENEKAEELMVQVNELYESTNTLQEDFVKNNPASYATPIFLANIQYQKTADELDVLLNSLDPKLDMSSTIQILKERVEKMKTVAIGKTAPDFTENDPDGNPITFSDIYSANDYTLLDFWAAWCGPCRAENPNVVEVFNDYNEKGFTVFGVSLDRAKDDWLKAIDDDGLAWKHVSDLGYWDSAVPKEYAVNSIPANFLVDKEGKIIAKGLRGEDLRSKISELLD